MSRKSILFLLGTLERSRCGVSDYVHLLVERLVSDGYSCICVALNDRFLQEKSSVSHQTINDGKCHYFRFAHSLSWIDKHKELKRIIQSFDPDLISLQFVPYAFNNKGFPIHLLVSIKFLVGMSNWHIMAHELWTMPRHGLIKRIFSQFQKLLILVLFKSVNPKVIHVSNIYYKDILRSFGLRSSVLPIFSNIPVIPLSYPRKKDNVWNFVFFGTLSPSWQYSSFFHKIELARIHYGIESCRFCLIGNCGDFANSLWNELEPSANGISFPFTFIQYGQLSPREISQYLHLADFGVTTIPSHLVDKSGGVAAMVAHNLPVIITNITDISLNSRYNKLYDDQFILMDRHFQDRLDVVNKPSSSSNQLILTTNQFILEVF